MRRSSLTRRWSVRGRRSDLDWTLEASGVRVSRSQKPGGWQCGNRKKLRLLVSQFTKHTSLHGAHFMCTNNHKVSQLRLVFYRLLVASCLVMTLASIVFLAQDSFSTESVFISSTDKDGLSGHEDDEYFPSYPKLTLCRKPLYRTDVNASERELLEYVFLALGFPFASIPPEERRRVVEYAQRTTNSSLTQGAYEVAERLDSLRLRYEDMKNSDVTFNVTKFIIENSFSCEKVFVRCQAFMYHLDCCKGFRPVLTRLGLCYSFVPNADLLKMEQEIRSIGFTLTFDLHTVPHFERDVEVGYRVYVSDPREPDVVNTNYGEAVNNGHVTVMRTKLIKTVRTALYTPWHGLNSDCPSMPSWLEQYDPGERYYRNECFKLLTEQTIRYNCQCQGLGDRGKRMRLCDPVDMYKCFIQKTHRDNLSSMTLTCKEPCIEYTYESEANYLEIGVQNKSRLIFMYAGSQYILKEYRTTTVSSFLSQIGGAMGLYVGASIITAVEMVLFVVSWFWYRCVPHKNVTAVADSGSAFHRKATGRSIYFY